MPVALSWLLEQADLGLLLVAGESHGVEVDWAHAIELEEPTPWLTGGELVLTTGLRLPQSATAQGDYVKRLKGAAVAGIAFGTGIRFEHVPPTVVTTCHDVGLPLIEVPLPTPFVAITKRLAERLALEQNEVLQQALTFQRLLTRQTLRRGLDGLVDTLASELTANVVLLDEDMNALAVSRLASSLASRLPEELREASDMAALGGVRRLRSNSGTLETHRLRGRSGFLGWLAVHSPGELPPGARLLTNQTVSLATLRLDQPAELEEARATLGTAVLRLLLEGDPMANLALSGLSHLGMTSDANIRILWIDGQERDGLALGIARQLSRSRIRHAQAADEAGVIIMVCDGDHQAALDTIEAMAQLGNATRPIGVSGAMPPARSAWALIQAQQAGRVAEQSGSPCLSFETLALEGIVADDAIHDRVRALTEGVVAPLLGQSPSSSEDRRTVRAFLDHNGAWDPASRELGIHRHTLRARIARIEHATNLSMSRAEDRALLLLALLSHEQ